MSTTSKSQDLVKRIVDTLKTVLPHNAGGVPLHEPCFDGNERSFVKECLDSTFVSSVGKFVDKFELMLADFTGVKSVVATMNGTAALHVALQLAGVEAGDEVIVPALCFVATANAVTYLRAVPHFADSEFRTLGLDPVKLSDHLAEIARVKDGCCRNRFTGRRIKAVVPMHTFGHPVDLDSLQEVCSRYLLVMVEDAAESLGSLYKGKHTGHWGQCSALSFNGNKIITTGGGGALLTNDESLGKLAKHITTTAKLPHAWSYCHDRTAYNYRLPNINAALGCAQLEQLPRFLNNKRNLAQRYASAFAEVDGVRFFKEPESARSNYWLNVLLLEDADPEGLDQILRATNASGFMTRPVWTLMHRLPMFSECPRMDLSVAENLEARTVNIPSSAIL